MVDYIFPDIIAKVLRKPSDRTQLEASLIGVTFMLLGSLGMAIYFIGFTDMSIWFKILLGFGEIGILSFQFSLLVTTYIQYYTLKKTLGLYPIDYQLRQKIIEAKDLITDLNSLVELNLKEEVKQC